MKPFGIKVQTRLIYSLLLLLFVFLSVFISFRIIERNAITLLFENDASEKERVFDQLLRLKGASLEEIAFDYTYWDEMLAAVSGNDKAWANMNLSLVALNNYNINSIWVYDSEGGRFYSINDLDDDKLPGIEFPQEVFNQLLEKRFAHFFIDTTSGLMEMRAATIHPSKDAQRQSRPQGYFFSGRLWTDNYIKEISELTDSTIQLRQWSAEAEGPESGLKRGVVIFLRDIKGWDGRPFKQMVVSRASREIREFNETSKKYFIFIFILAAALSFLSAFMIIKWVSLPLHSISAALKADDLKYIQRLRRDKTEFGDITRLIFEFSRQKEELRAILDKSPFGVYVVNDKGDVDYVNPAMLEISGDTEEQFRSICLPDLPAYKESGLCDEIRSVIRERKPFYRRAVPYTSPFSHKATIRNMSGMPFEEEGTVKALIFVEDVTERENLERMKSSLIHMIVHDLNNPLAGIMGNIELMKMEMKDRLSEDQKNYLYFMGYSARQMRDMVSDLLDINKMEEGKFNLKLEDVELNSLFSEIRDAMKVIANSDNKSIITEVAAGMKARADGVILRRIISNLIGNALKFTPSGSAITAGVRYNESRGEFLFSVKDRGEGIPREYLPRVFDKFVQVDPAQAKARRGKGLGLTFCKMAVEAHGGRIWAESEMGAGSTFYFTIPDKK
ncbi:MAG: ATP-binding protein [Candidatus Omnitrophota bacterium]|jgi:PAS domain S-box-containing protein